MLRYTGTLRDVVGRGQRVESGLSTRRVTAAVRRHSGCEDAPLDSGDALFKHQPGPLAILSNFSVVVLLQANVGIIP
jgi:hypothetical protein